MFGVSASDSQRDDFLNQWLNLNGLQENMGAIFHKTKRNKQVLHSCNYYCLPGVSLQAQLHDSSEGLLSLLPLQNATLITSGQSGEIGGRHVSRRKRP